MTKIKSISETIINCSLIATLLSCVLLVVAGAFEMHLLKIVSAVSILTFPIVMYFGIILNEYELKEKIKNVHEIKKGDGRYEKGEYVVEYKGAEYSFPSEAAAVGVFIDALGDLHRKRIMATDLYICSS